VPRATQTPQAQAGPPSTHPTAKSDGTANHHHHYVIKLISGDQRE